MANFLVYLITYSFIHRKKVYFNLVQVRNFLPDRIFLLNHYEELSLMMMCLLRSIKIYYKSLKINKLN